MKTTLKTIAAGLILTTSVFGVNASEISTGVKFVEVADYKLEVESWMVNEELFESSELTTENSSGLNEFVEVADYKLEVENWMVSAELFGTLDAGMATCEVVEIEVSNPGNILVESLANEGSLESDL